MSNELPLVNEKRKLRWLRILIIILCTLIVVPIGLIYLTLFDSNHKQIDKVPDFNMQQVATEAFIDSFDYTVSDNKMSVRISEDEFNQLLLIALSSLPKEVSGYLPSLYVEVGENSTYNFFIEGSVPMFKTKLYIETILVQIENTEDYEFKIIDIKLGKINGLQYIAKTLLSDQMLEDIFKNAGLSIKSDLSNYRLLYSTNALINDIIKKIPNLDGIALGMFDTLCENHKISIDTLNKSLCFDINLAGLDTNEYYYVNDDFKGVTQDKIDTDLSYLVNEMRQLEVGTYPDKVDDIKQLSKTKLRSIIDFPNLKSDYLTTTLINSIGAFDQTILHLGESLTLQEEIAYEIIDPTREKYTIKGRVTEAEFNTLLFDSSIVGDLQPFYYPIDGGYKLNYIVIDNVYSNLYNDYLDFIITMNLSGKKIVGTIHCQVNKDNTSQAQLTLDVKDLKIGDLPVSESLKQTFFGYVRNAVNKSQNLIKIDEEHLKVIIDLTNAVNLELEKNIEFLNEIMIVLGVSGTFKPSDVTYSLIGDSKSHTKENYFGVNFKVLFESDK